MYDAPLDHNVHSLQSTRSPNSELHAALGIFYAKISYHTELQWMMVSLLLQEQTAGSPANASGTHETGFKLIDNTVRELIASI